MRNFFYVIIVGSTLISTNIISYIFFLVKPFKIR